MESSVLIKEDAWKKRIAGVTLDEIAGYFGLTHRGGVSFVLHQVKQM